MIDAKVASNQFRLQPVEVGINRRAPATVWQPGASFIAELGLGQAATWFGHVEAGSVGHGTRRVNVTTR
jgi:hypothetical protein